MIKFSSGVGHRTSEDVHWVQYLGHTNVKRESLAGGMTAICKQYLRQLLCSKQQVLQANFISSMVLGTTPSGKYTNYTARQCN